MALVLEEDAVLDSKSLHRLQDRLADMKEFYWDLLMLETGHFGLNDVWKYVGTTAATCENCLTLDCSEVCGWMGSMGYLITERWAELLSKNDIRLWYRLMPSWARRIHSIRHFRCIGLCTA